MKELLLLYIIILSAIVSNAQLSATTADGSKVILYNNGTWNYADSAAKTSIERGGEYFKPFGTNCIIKGQDVKYVVVYDSSLWQLHDTAINKQSDFSMSLKNSETSLALLIPEKTTASLESLRDIALANARKNSKNVVVLKQEYRKVNKKDILYLEFTTEVQGFTFLFMAYYYTSPVSCIQFVTYTEISNAEKEKPKMRDLLNGLILP
ncbi:MAG: hypothetical protein SGJ10_07945 [Bacteroidota bacterium]|nr:hypothetical protein [Bacteroidota bacterium]